MELISSVTVGSGGASNITFSSIPGTYTDLVVLISGRSATGANQDAMRMQFNADTGANYSSRNVYSDTVSSVSSTAYNSIGYFLNVGWFSANNSTASTFSNFSIIIPNYCGSSVKTASFDAVAETNNATLTGGLAFAAGRWNSTAAITSIKIYTDFGNNLVEHSTAYLYGILKGSGGATVS